ncbi:hypothetical protein EJ419_04155 [Alloscardovia theropitheci]|uniref:Mub B2-like domain-containing protein n=1 Tax=Alloscardovia theropitheci TaxID=2496842 RepID=A0A4V2MTY1_9BIFI|nr:hypothetical protein [Alloscardovia theropitheci]TCD54239.1 hypothetical protein EJ419_04155 [Alloscardovia theropitheci]
MPYDQAVEDVPESKIITRTIQYQDKDNGRVVSREMKQTVTLTRTNVRNKVTGAITYGTWTTGTFDAVDSPAINGYGDPDKATIDEAEVTADSVDETIIVLYEANKPQTPSNDTSDTQSTQRPALAHTGASVDVIAVVVAIILATGMGAMVAARMRWNRRK